MKDPWSLLTSDEQSVISTKTNRETFTERIGDISDREIENKVTLVRNFIDSMGGHDGGAIWAQIKSLEGVWLGEGEFHEGGGVKFVVYDNATFIETLRKNGYAINTWYDRNLNKKTHPNDSAREITNTSRETAAHLTNDDSINPDLFLLHWDKRSSEFKHIDRRYLFRWVEQLAAGTSHHEPFTAAEVRKGLIERGIAS
jgi:hypothetical protein